MESKSTGKPPRDAKSSEYDVGDGIVLSELPPAVALKLECINTQYHQLRETYPTPSSPPIGEAIDLIQTVRDILSVFEPTFGLEDGLSAKHRKDIQSSYRPAQILASDFLQMVSPKFPGKTGGEFMKWRLMEQGKPEKALILGLGQLYRCHLHEVKFRVALTNKIWNSIGKIEKNFQKVSRAWKAQITDPTLYAGNDPEAAELAVDILETLFELLNDVSDEEATFLMDVFSHVIATCSKFLNDCYGTSNPINALMEKRTKEFQCSDSSEGKLGNRTKDAVEVVEECLNDLRKRNPSNKFEVPFRPGEHLVRVGPLPGYPWYDSSAIQILRDSF